MRTESKGHPPASEETWRAFDGGATIARSGSEGGAIVLDEEHPLGARITLEAALTHAPFAITCGVYGWMVHTRYLGLESEARAQYTAMKHALEAILVRFRVTSETPADEQAGDRIGAIEQFVADFP